MRPDHLHLLAWGVLFALVIGDASAATTNTTTPAPDVTPAPSAGTPLRLSFVIDGVVYAVQCNFTGFNMSNCSFVADHGLTVTPLSGSTEIPQYIVAILGTTLGLVGALTGMAAYLVWSRNTGKTSQGYAPVEQPPPAQQPAQYQQPGQYQQQPGQYYAEPVPQQYTAGNMARAGGRPKIISVNLVQPCLPPEP